MSGQSQQLGSIASKLLFENEHVNVWEMDVAPKETFGLHHHKNDYVLFITAGADLKVREPDRRTYVFEALERQVYFIPAGGMESFQNVSKTAFKEALIEVKDARRPGQNHEFTACSALVGMKPFPGLINVLENDRVRVSELTLGPGEEAGMKQDGLGAAVFVVDGGKVKVIEEGGKGSARSHEEERGYGAVRWLPNGTRHNLVNVGGTVYRQVSVEVK